MKPQILYSPTTGGFYIEGVSSCVPKDARRITPERHATLLAHGGAHIGTCPDTGKPISTAPKPNAADRRAALLRQIKAEAQRRIFRVAPLWRQINDLTEPNEGTAQRQMAIMAIRDASTLIEDQLADTKAANLSAFPITDNPLWPEAD